MTDTVVEQKPAVPVHPAVFAPGADGEPQLAGSRCANCGATFFPRRPVCARCLSQDMKTLPLTGAGRIHTYTIVHQSTPEFRTPYVLAYVDLPEGVRILAPVEGVPADEVRIGMPVRLQIETLRTDVEGRGIVGYRFYPAEATSAAGGAREAQAVAELTRAGQEVRHA